MYIYFYRYMDIGMYVILWPIYDETAKPTLFKFFV